MGSLSQRFLTSEGLMPSTIFDRDPDMDVSEEMEEIREILYALIKKSFPMGVSSTHLAEKYSEEYVSIGLGRELPSDWLEQVTAAEEFEAQVRGPLTILFVRLNNTSSFKRPQVPHTNVKIISPNAGSFEPSTQTLQEQGSPISSRKSPHDLAKQFQFSVLDLDWSSARDVITTYIESVEEIWLANSDETQIKRLDEKMNDWYAKNGDFTEVQSHEVCANGAYAIKDDDGNWRRAIATSTERVGLVECVLVDSGRKDAYSVERIRFLTCPQADTPSLAARCTLDLPYLNNTETTDMLRSILLDKDVQGNEIPKKVKAFLLGVADGKNPRKVCILSQYGNNVKDDLLEMSSPGKENQQETEMAPRLITPPQLSQINTQFSDFGIDSEIIPMEPSEMPSKPFLAHALFAAGPADISLRQSSLDPMPDYMYQRLADECQSSAALLKETPKPGKYYAAKIDDRWERVICVRSSKIDPAAFCVYLIDVGAFHYVRGDAMRLLNSKTPFKKMLMFKSKIAGIAPVGGQDVWSRESHLAVREFFEACLGEPVEVVVQMVPVGPVGSSVTQATSSPTSSLHGWTKWKQLNAPAVPLVEARISCAGRDLADWLIACGLAVPVPIL